MYTSTQAISRLALVTFATYACTCGDAINTETPPSFSAYHSLRNCYDFRKVTDGGTEFLLHVTEKEVARVGCQTTDTARDLDSHAC